VVRNHLEGNTTTHTAIFGFKKGHRVRVEENKRCLSEKGLRTEERNKTMVKVDEKSDPV